MPLLRRTLFAPLALASLVACADREPPTWPSAGELRAEPEGNAVVLRWVPASDDEGLAGYELATNGAFPLRLEASASSHRLAGLATGRALRFALVALDDAGNRSEALVAELTLPAPAPARAEAAAPAEARGDDAAPDDAAPDDATAEVPAARPVLEARPALPSMERVPQLPMLPTREALGGSVTLRPAVPGTQLQLPDHLRQVEIVRPGQAPEER